MKIAVFMGGTSSEREISLKSGEAILDSLIRQGYDAYGVVIDEKNHINAFLNNDYDLAYMALHGGYGENGTYQGILDILGKKYTGSGATESAAAMDKIFTRAIAKNIGIKVAKEYKNIKEIEKYPVVVKPSRDGSSVGVYFCENEEEVKNALDKVKKPLIEDAIVGDELTVGVMNNEPMGVLRIIPKNKYYDFESKYAKGGSVHEYPAKIRKDIYDLAMKNAQKIHKELGLSGISRSDFLLKDGELYFLEVNTCPGMTSTSLIPDIATLLGYTFDDVVRKNLESIEG